jgi:predicted esterase YcpF (UPF0227 family)
MVIIYVHGFGGSGEGHKARVFRKHYEDKIFIAPSLSYVPKLAVNTLDELIISYKCIGQKIVLIGSSMGGFMSIYLSQKHDLKTVLINPAVYSYETLKRAVGHAPNFFDSSTFEWNEEHLKMLKEYKTDIKGNKDYLVMLQKGDELLNYKDAYNIFKEKINPKNMIVEDGGSHLFENIESKFGIIDNFLKT